MIYTLTLNPALDKEYRVDQIQFNEVLRASQMRVDFGGKGFNVSRMLTVLGVQNEAIGLVGGASGMQLRDGLKAAGIPTDFVQVRGETRTNISIVEDGFKRHIKINETGPLVSLSEMDALMAVVQKKTRKGDWWVLSGSLPPGLPQDTYAIIIHIVQSRGAFAVLDTSGEPMRFGCQAGPCLVKPNLLEASQITGKPVESSTQIQQAFEDIHCLGVKNIVISAGKQGAYFYNENQVLYGRSVEIQEHNPIGASDAMLAGILWQLAEGHAPSDALSWGLACGAAAASQAGTSTPPLDIIKKLYGKINIKILT